MSETFESILGKTDDQIESPQPLPVGEYEWLVSGQPRFDKSKQKQTDFVEFTCVGQRALDTVDQDDLDRAGGIQGKTRRLTFYITEDSAWRLRDFLFDHLQIDRGITLKEAIAQAPGRTFVGTVKHSTSPDGQRIYDNISNTAAV